MHFNSQGISLTATPDVLAISGSMALQALRLRSPLSGVLPMGSYSFDMQGGLAPSLEVRTMEGQLRLSGKGNWSASHHSLPLQASNNALDRPELGSILR